MKIGVAKHEPKLNEYDLSRSMAVGLHLMGFAPLCSSVVCSFYFYTFSIGG